MSPQEVSRVHGAREVVARAADMSPTSPAFAVHVASYKTRSYAERDAGGYRNRDHPTHVVRVNIPGRGPFYRVLVGRFGSRDAAGRAANRLKSSGLTGYAAVVHLPAPREEPVRPVTHLARDREGPLKGPAHRETRALPATASLLLSPRP